jgi:hypothetical protein
MEPRKDITKQELLEWFGITPADFMVYASLAAAAAMYFAVQPVVDGVLAAIAIILSIVACPFGMKRNPEFSEFTNIVKLVSYIPFAMLVVGWVVVHYAFFNNE